MPTYRMDFVVPDDLDVAEEPPTGEPVFNDPIPNPILEGLRVALNHDSRWEFSRVTPLRPWGDPHRQHVIVWVDITRTDAETLLREDVHDLVTDALPGASLIAFIETGLRGS
jgi:hypothetical protein